MGLDNNISFYDAIEYDEFLFFSSIDFNGLFRLSKRDKYTEFLGKFPEENSWMLSMFRRVFCITDKLIFVPCFAKGIHIYRINEGSFELHRLRTDEYEYVHFSNAFEYGDTLLLIPSNRITLEKGFYAFDPVLERGKWETDLNNDIMDILPDSLDYICDVWGCCLIGGVLYLCVYGTNILLEINLSQKNVRKYVAREGTKLRNTTLSAIGDGILVITSVMSDEIVLFDIVTHKFSYKKGPTEATTIIVYNNELILVPRIEQTIFVADSRDIEWKPFVEIPKTFERTNSVERDSFIGYSYMKDDKICIYPRCFKGMLIIDMINRKIECVAIRYPDSFVQTRESFIYEDLSNRFVELNGIIPEVVSSDLEYYVRGISQDMYN